VAAPKGNANALKHGFYARQYRASELKDLDLLLKAGTQVNLFDEIALLRVTMRRTMELANGIQDFDKALKWLNVQGASTTRLATLLKTQLLLKQADPDELDVITKVIQQVNKDWQMK
jgi:hypothetical protein